MLCEAWTNQGFKLLKIGEPWVKIRRDNEKQISWFLSKTFDKEEKQNWACISYEINGSL